MAIRVNTQNPCAVLCCYSWLGLIAAIKGVINFIFSAIYLCIPCTLISLVYLLPNLQRTYWTLIVTPSYGPNLKVLMFLSLWFPIMVFPVFILLLSFLGGLCIGFAFPCAETFDDKDWLLWSGFLEAYQSNNYWVKECYDTQDKRYSEYLREFRIVTTAPPGGPPPFDIAITQLIVCFFVGLVNALYLSLFVLIMGLLKLIPMLLRSIHGLWSFYIDIGWVWMILLFPFMVVAHPLLVVINILGYIISVVGAFLYGCKSMNQCYQHGIWASFKWTRVQIDDYQRWTNDFIFAS